MSATLEGIRIWRRSGGVAVSFSCARAGVCLTKSGKVEILSHVHAYLAHWAARAAEGTAPRPATWPEFSYKNVAGVITVPVAPVPGEAEQVAGVLASVLSRPGMVRPVSRRRR